MQRVSSRPSKAAVRRSIGSAEECTAYIANAGTLLRLLGKHTSPRSPSVLQNTRDEWPDDYAAWMTASKEVGLVSSPDASVDVDDVLGHVYSLGLSITYLATIETPSGTATWTYDGFELLMSMGGPACRYVVRCEGTGKVEGAHVEWQCHSTQWTRLDKKIGNDALRCLALVGYGAAHQWPLAKHSLSAKRFRARYQPMPIVRPS